MIPALRRQKEVSIAAPAESIKREPDEEKPYDALESAIEDLCQAVEKKDYKLGAAALRAAFELLDSEPHEEGEHV